jgi:putative ABC transport system substrate-binding protein
MNNARANQEVIAVIYPDIPRFKDIFTKIISGIQQGSTHKIMPYTLSDDFSPDDFRSWARALHVKVVIAIGNSGMSAADSVKGKIPIISNAFLVPDLKDDNVVGISLAVDPNVLVGTLSAVAPEVKRISVVYNPEISGWLIDIAKSAAKEHGLKLIAYEADDIRSATRLYAKILEQSKPTQDAIWLPQDRTTVNDEIILPMILKGAWNHSLVFFSSIGSHAKNGALFSLYPDYAGLGGSLAMMADKYIDSTSSIHMGIQPLEDLQYAVNIRTADHLNLDIDKSGIKFDLVFPTPKD